MLMEAVFHVRFLCVFYRLFSVLMNIILLGLLNVSHRLCCLVTSALII